MPPRSKGSGWPTGVAGTVRIVVPPVPSLRAISPVSVFCVMTKPSRRNFLPLVGTHTSASEVIASALKDWNTLGVASTGIG